MENSPDEGVISPPRIRRKVDLPQPDGPTMQTNSPSGTSRLKSWRACTGPLREGYVLPRAVAFIFTVIR